MMKVVFFSLVLNHHQACLADVFYDLLGKDYFFVETGRCTDQKGSTDDYSTRPYILKSWASKLLYSKAMELALTADACVFDGVEALPFEKERVRRGLLSFDTSERYLKRGLLNLASPVILKMILTYHFAGWYKKPIYKLCMSAYAANDHYHLFSYKDKCYKWGYFTYVDEKFKLDVPGSGTAKPLKAELMWCARFLKWKHPELPVLLASRLRREGYDFVIDMYGDGIEWGKTKQLACQLGVTDVVNFRGNVPNSQILEAMRSHDIFLFTSDKNEGWGAVLNESMSNGCAVVGSNAIGSVPYLINDGTNGLVFQSGDIDSLYEKVTLFINNTVLRDKCRIEAVNTMQKLWSPQNAAKSFLSLIDNLSSGCDTAITEGPCSKALPV